ncbi:MAG: response regulator [Janthinobacterium lividum]
MATILIVDDEMGITGLMSEILGDEGHNVEVAHNAQEAREHRLRQASDLVLLDIWMPDTDGLTLLKEWAAQGLLTMPVIMMSGHATIDTAVEATKIGAVGFLEKPIALQKLLKVVKEALTRVALQPEVLSTAQAAQAAQQAASARAAAPLASAANAATATLGNIDAVPSECRTPSAEPGGSMGSISFDIPLRAARDAFERAYFEYHLARENSSMTRVAEKTGLERTHLYRKMRLLGIEIAKNKGE